MGTVSSSNSRIAKNTLFLYIRMVFVLFVSLYTSRVILRTLGVVDFGVYNVVGGFVSMFAFLNTSMSNAIQRYFNFALGKKEQDGLQNVYVTALTIQFLLMLIVIILVETVGIWYLNNKMVIPPDRIQAAHNIFQFSVLSMVFLMLQIPYSAAIMAIERMNFYAFVGVADVLLKLAVALTLPLFSADKLVWYGFLMFSISVIDFVLYFIDAKRHIPELKLKFNFHKDLFKSMFGFSGWNIFGTFAFMLKGQGLNMVLNLFFGPIINAARGISFQIMNAMQGFSSNIVVAFRPQLIQSYAAENYVRVRNIFYSESKITYILMYVIVVPVILELEYILDLWLGHDVVPDYTKSFTILVLTNMLVSTFHTPMTQIVHATGKMKVFQITISCIICSIVPISWLFLKLGYGPNSTFIVSLILTIINIFASLTIVHSLFPFQYGEYFKKVLLPCVVATLFIPILPTIIRFLMNDSFWRLMLVGIADLISASVITYYFVLDKSEKRLVLDFIKKKIRK